MEEMAIPAVREPPVFGVSMLTSAGVINVHVGKFLQTDELLKLETVWSFFSRLTTEHQLLGFRRVADLFSHLRT